MTEYITTKLRGVSHWYFMKKILLITMATKIISYQPFFLCLWLYAVVFCIKQLHMFTKLCCNILPSYRWEDMKQTKLFHCTWSRSNSFNGYILFSLITDQSHYKWITLILFKKVYWNKRILKLKMLWQNISPQNCGAFHTGISWKKYF